MRGIFSMNKNLLVNFIVRKSNDKEFYNILLNNNIPFQSKKLTSDRLSYEYKNCLFVKGTKKALIKELNNLSRKDNSEFCEVNTDIYYIFSDGGSFNNGYKNKDLPMFASMGTIIIKDEKEIYKESSGIKDATNNYAELNAGITGLDVLFNKLNVNNSIIVMCSDSQYLIKGINEWLYSYIKRGWKNNEGKPISNINDWKKLWIKYLNKNDNVILGCWVKGHTELDSFYYKYNDECDLICNIEINKLLTEENLPLRKIKNR